MSTVAPTQTEVARWFRLASRGSNRRDAADLVMSGRSLETVARLDTNYRAWCTVIDSVSKGGLVNPAPTYLRRSERALEDLLRLGPRLPEDIQWNAALVLRDVQELRGTGQGVLNFVYAFRTPARPGVRVGETTRGEGRLKSHRLAYVQINPVALFWPPVGSSPKQLQDLILDDLRGFRDDSDQDWHNVGDGLVHRVAFNHGATLVVKGDEICRRAGCGLAPA